MSKVHTAEQSVLQWQHDHCSSTPEVGSAFSRQVTDWLLVTALTSTGSLARKQKKTHHQMAPSQLTKPYIGFLNISI